MCALSFINALQFMQCIFNISVLYGVSFFEVFSGIYAWFDLGFWVSVLNVYIVHWEHQPYCLITYQTHTKNVKFDWNSSCKTAFERLERKIVVQLQLWHFKTRRIKSFIGIIQMSGLAQFLSSPGWKGQDDSLCLQRTQAQEQRQCVT